jgi:predicted NBD/HSP70 family sugar kinase
VAGSLGVERSGGPRSVSGATRERIVRYVAALAGRATQARIARLARLSPATVSTLIRDLQRDGVIELRAEAPDRRGQVIAIANLPGLAIGVELGQAHISVCARAIASDRAYFAESRESGANRRGAWLQTTGELVQRLVEDNNLGSEPVVSVGLGIPAPVLPVSGEVFTPAILQGWEGAKPGVELGRLLSAPVEVDNEANLAAYGEYLYGADTEVTSMIYLKMSVGVGAGIILNGRILRGWSGIAGEVGHLSIDPNGPVCRCGNRGCLETFISSAHLVEQAAVALRGFGRSKAPEALRDLISLANDGEPACVRVLQDAGQHIGRAIATCSMVLNPECVVLGGELGVLAGHLILAPARESYRNFALRASAGPTIRIKKSEMAITAPAAGALAWGLVAGGHKLKHANR